MKVEDCGNISGHTCTTKNNMDEKNNTQEDIKNVVLSGIFVQKESHQLQDKELTTIVRNTSETN